jgi:hypothetical protein
VADSRRAATAREPHSPRRVRDAAPGGRESIRPGSGVPLDRRAQGVGYLSREEAAQCKPGLLALQNEHGTPIVLEGAIIGGGKRDDGPERLGVFLYYDRMDFGLPASRARSPRNGKMRTALSDAMASDNADNSYDLGWMREIPVDHAHAIP